MKIILIVALFLSSCDIAKNVIINNEINHNLSTDCGDIKVSSFSRGPDLLLMFSSDSTDLNINTDSIITLSESGSPIRLYNKAFFIKKHNNKNETLLHNPKSTVKKGETLVCHFQLLDDIVPAILIPAKNYLSCTNENINNSEALKLILKL